MQSGKHGTAPLARGKPDPKLLLPPLSVLVPPGKLAEAGGGLSSPTRATHTPSNAEQSVQQMAGTLWAEHAPRIKASGSVAADEVSKFAGRVIHQGADTLHGVGSAMADPAKRSGLWARYRTLILASTAGVVVLAAVGWVAACHIASTAANQQIHAVLVQKGLASNIQFGSVSASPFGNMTFYDVTLRFSDNDPQPIKIGSLTVNGLVSSQTMPRAMSFSATHVECPVSKTGAFSTQLNELGYSSITGDLSVSYRFVEPTLSIKSSAHFEQVGGWNTSLELTGMSAYLLNNVISSQRNGNPENQESVLQVARLLGALQLQSANVQLDNKGLVQRGQAIPDTPFPQKPVLPDNASPLAQWRMQGGNLNIATQLQSPIIIMQIHFPYPAEVNPAFLGLDNFIEQTHATVTLD